jgi:hypothetical protein
MNPMPRVSTERFDELAHRLMRGTGLVQSTEKTYGVLVVARPLQKHSGCAARSW